MAERVTIRTTDGVADVRLNRPEKLNALDFAMFAALSEAGRELAENSGVRGPTWGWHMAAIVSSATGVGPGMNSLG